MGEIKVTFGEITQAASAISSGASQVESQLEDLRQAVTKTLAGYEGDAAVAYQEAQSKWDQAADDLQKVLAAIGTAVGQAGDAYQAAEKSNVGRW